MSASYLSDLYILSPDKVLFKAFRFFWLRDEQARPRPKINLILKWEAPYDIFIRWKSIDKQPVGRDPDLNDGVRLNIRPFMKIGDVKKKGVGILREKPNIKWTKDRSKDVELALWYHRFNGDCVNDHHLTLEEKRVARMAKAKETK